MAGNDTDVVNATEAGAILRCSSATVTRWAKHGRIPFVKRGQQGKSDWLFSRHDIQRIAEARNQARQLLGAVPL